jgi:Fur family zinc uptake transcriptional regulator
MSKQRKSTASVLSQANAKCTRSGSRLTTKRAQVLEVLLSSSIPLSAYEIVAQYNETTDQTMQPMSVYRILQFLESEQLVHKLSLQNKYIACSHIACSHPHEVPQFLICRNCQRTKEISIHKSVIDELAQQAEKSGFELMNSQIELDCLCDDCLAQEQNQMLDKKARKS